jgi:DNA polymerase I-like protein with 3'-5' exonuclease and polymerase domains
MRSIHEKWEDIIGSPLEEGVENKLDCPAHASVSGESLGVKLSDEGKVLITCRAGCETDEVLRALDLTYADLYLTNGHKTTHKKKEPRKASFDGAIAMYQYVSPNEEPVSRSVRFPDKNGKKVVRQAYYRDGDWWWDKPEGFNPVPYDLHLLMRGLLAGETIYIFEGEPDAHAAQEMGLVATTNPGGAGKFAEELVPHFYGADVVIAPDDDGPGIEHAEDVATKLHGMARSVKLLSPLPNPEGKIGFDFRDWVEAGGTKEEFAATTEATQLFSPGPLGGPREFKEKLLLPTESLKEVLEEAEENKEYFARPLFRKGELSLLVGAAKFSGKTTLTFSAINAIVSGDPFLGEGTKRAKVLYLSEQGNNLSQAIESSRLDVSDTENVAVVRFRSVWNEPWTDVIDRAVYTAKEQGREILVVDTFAAFSHLKGSEENDAGPVSERLEPLKLAAQAHDLAVALIHHSGRESVIRGSSAFDATVDTIIILSRPQGNQDETVRTIEAYGRCEPFKINAELTKEGVYVPIGSDSRVAFTKAVNAMRKVLPRKQEGAQDVNTLVKAAKASGAAVSKTKIEEALHWLHKQETVQREGEGVRGNPYLFWMPDSLFTPGGSGNGSGRNAEEAQNPHRNADYSPEPFLGETYYLDFETHAGEGLATDPNLATPRLAQLSRGEDVKLYDLRDPDALAAFSADLGDRTGTLVAHNAGFELRILERLGLEWRGDVFDTLVADKILCPHGEDVPTRWNGIKYNTQGNHRLEAIVERYLGEPMDKSNQKSDWSADELSAEQLEYARKDTEVLVRLHEVLASKLDDVPEDVWKQDMELVKAVSTLPAIDIDSEEYDRLLESHTAAFEAARKRCNDLGMYPVTKAEVDARKPKKRAEHEMSAGSAADVKAACGAKSHADAALRKAGPKGIALADFKKAASDLNKLVETWGPRAERGSVRPGFNIGKVWTGRMSSSEPNVQQLDKDTGVRRLLTPGEGRVWVAADYSQVEPRVMAALVGDDAADRALNTEDVYQSVADEIGCTRKEAKAIFLGWGYGRGLTTLANELDGDEVRAQKLVKHLERTFPGAHARRLQASKDFGYGTAASEFTIKRTAMGRPLPCFDYTTALNCEIQGTAAEMMKRSILRALESGLDVRLAVHDELVISAPESEWEEHAARLKACMSESAASILSGNYPVEVEYGPNYGALAEDEDDA